MDNLTHSLAGALLGQAGLKRLTGRATATLVIAANIPDIDAIATVLGTESLAIRRGITHGPVAVLLLPPLLAGLVLLWNRWRPAAEPVRAGPLLLLAYIGTLSHPALDWLNSYGIRLLEPFSSRWFYGDTLFIIDVWIWAALIAGVLLSRRRERLGGAWQRPAVLSLSAILAYILANGLITTRAETLAARQLAAGGRAPQLVVANPRPLLFWSRQILWRDAATHGSGHYALGRGVRLDGKVAAINLADPALLAARNRADVRAFLFWSRMPLVIEDRGRLHLADQRFTGNAIRSNFLVPLAPERR